MTFPLVFTSIVPWLGILCQTVMLCVIFWTKERALYTAFIVTNLLIGCSHADQIVTYSNNAHTLAAQIPLVFAGVALTVAGIQHGDSAAREGWLGGLLSILLLYLWEHRYPLDSSGVLGNLISAYRVAGENDSPTFLGIFLSVLYFQGSMLMRRRFAPNDSFFWFATLPLYVGTILGGAFLVIIAQHESPLFSEILMNVVVDRIAFMTVALPAVYILFRIARKDSSGQTVDVVA